MEPVWDVAIRHGRVQRLLPLLEALLANPADRELLGGGRASVGEGGGRAALRPTRGAA